MRGAAGRVYHQQVEAGGVEGGFVVIPQGPGRGEVAVVREERSAALLAGWEPDLAAGQLEQLDRRGVGLGKHDRHHAAGQEGHPHPGSPDRWGDPGGRRPVLAAKLGQLPPLGHDRRQPDHLGCARETAEGSQPARTAEQLAHRDGGHLARRVEAAQPLHLGPSMLDDPAVGNARRADRLAGAAAEAEVDVPGELLGEGKLAALPLRHQVEPPARRLGL